VKQLVAFCFILSVASTTWAATTYYSQSSGDPAVLSRWSTVRAGGGTAPANFTTGDVFVIQNTHNLTTTAAWSISGTGSKLWIENGGTLTAPFAVTLASATTFQIDGGGTYAHQNATAFGSTIFQAGTKSFAPTSTVILNNANTTGPSGVTFGNLTVNFTVDPGGSVNCSGGLTTINGNFTVQNTSTREFRLTGTTAYTLTIAGDLIVSGGTLSFGSGVVTGSGARVNLGGSLNHSGGTLISPSGASSGGFFKFTGGTPSVTATMQAADNFQKLDIIIDNGKTVTLNSDLQIGTITTRAMYINSGGTLNCNGFNVVGAGSFTNSAGATLGITSTAGIASSGATGNILVTGTRTFDVGANYIYNGTSAQVTGSGLPAAVNNLTINNATGVSLSASTTVNGTLTLTSGAFSVGANTLALNGPAIGGTPGNLTTTSVSTLSFAGSSAGVSIPSSVTALNNLIISNSSGVTLNAATTIAMALKINSGALALNYAGTASVAQLSFDNGATWQAVGTYGFTGSSAANQDATHFATSSPLGTVTVSGALQYRSLTTGNWSDASTWEASPDLTTWTAATVKPTSLDSVFVQAGHIVTLTGNEACNDLHISTGTTDAATGGDGQVALGTYAMDINGKLRCYFGNSLPGTASIVLPSSPITMTASSAGKIRFVGNSRTIMAVTDWSSQNVGATTTYATEIAMNSGQIATAAAVFKTSALTVASGTLSLSLRVGLDNGTTGQGDVTIASGAVLRSSAAGTTAGLQVMSRNPLTTGARAGTLTVESGGKLQLSGGTPCIDMNAIVLNGTVEYTGGTQTLVKKSGNDTLAADISNYANLILSGSGTKTLAGDTTVNGTLTRAGTASLGLGSFALNYGAASTLEYAGSGAQTTGNAELPASGGPHSVMINNANGVMLNGSKTISGTLTVSAGTTLDFNSQTFTAGATVLNGALTMLVNKTGANTFTGSKLVQSAGTLTYGGTLNLTATGLALAGGDAPVLFSAASYGATLPAAGAIPTLPVETPALNWYLGSLTNNGTIAVNRAPVANDNVAAASHGQSVTLGGPKLVGNDSDADGDTLAVISASASSGSASVLDGNVNYTAPGSGTSDTVAYTVSDGRGGTATANVNVTLASAAGAGFNQLAPVPLGNGELQLSFLGIPGTNYVLEITHALPPTGVWATLQTKAAAANGSLVFTNTPSLAPTNDFYRVRYSP